MSVVPLHASGGLHLPLNNDTALAVLGVGLLVFAVITYDAYRTYYA